MDGLSYESAGIAVREDLAAAHARAWERLAAPGTWLDAERRLAVAAETRAAADCAYCAECKAALSPYRVAGSHRAATDLPENAVEVVHRIATDPGRLSRSWFERAMESGIGDAAFVEMVGVAATVTAVDMFCRAIGIAPHPFARAASRRAVAQAARGRACRAGMGSHAGAGRPDGGGILPRQRLCLARPDLHPPRAQPGARGGERAVRHGRRAVLAGTARSPTSRPGTGPSTGRRWS